MPLSAVPVTPPLARAPRVSFHGDSIGLLFGNMEPGSPFFWSQVRQPRKYELLYQSSAPGVPASTTTGPQFSVSGSSSGPLYAGAGRTGNNLLAASANDMNASARLAGITAFAPDDMFIQIGSNESPYAAAPDATILNIKDVIAANPNPNKRIIIMSSFSKTNYDLHVLNYNRWAEQMARSNPNYFFLDIRPYCLDSTSTSGATLAGVSTDGVHPHSAFGRSAYAAVDRMLDKLGYEKVSPRSINALDVYDATKNPAGNLLGTKGNMTGTTGTLGANVTGTVPTGWTASTNSTELTAAASIQTLNDARGIAKRYTTFTFSAAAALTAGRTFTFTTSVSNTQQARKISAQLLAQFANLSGCWAIGFGIVSSNAPLTSFNFGTGGNTVALALPTSATPENMDLVAPEALIPDVGNNNNFNLNITVTFLSGSTPAGTVSFADAGVWQEVTTFP